MVDCALPSESIKDVKIRLGDVEALRAAETSGKPEQIFLSLGSLSPRASDL